MQVLRSHVYPAVDSEGTVPHESNIVSQRSGLRGWEVNILH